MVTIIPAYNALFGSAQDSYSETACRSSVLLKGKANIEIGPVSKEKVTPLACTTKDAGVLEGNQEEVLREVGDLASTCWWMFAEGSVPDLWEAEANTYSCHICSTFLISEQATPISGGEIGEFMLSNNYNPSALKGGASYRFAGDGVDLTIPQLSTDTVVSIDDLQSKQLTSFIDDNANILDETDAINDKMNNILLETGVTGYIVTAGQIEDVSRRSAQQALDRYGFFEGNQTNGFLLTVSLEDKTARLDMGADVTTYISEYEIETLLDPLRNAQSKEQLGRALETVVSEIETAMTDSEETSFNPSSYYGYLSNAGETLPVLPEELNSSTTYAVTYTSYSTDGDLPFGFTAEDIEQGSTYLSLSGGAGALPIFASGQVLSTGVEYLLEDTEEKYNFIQISPYSQVVEECNT